MCVQIFRDSSYHSVSHAATKFANMDMGIQLVAVVVCIDSEASQIGAKRLRGATMATGRCEIKLRKNTTTCDRIVLKDRSRPSGRDKNTLGRYNLETKIRLDRLVEARFLRYDIICYLLGIYSVSTRLIVPQDRKALQYHFPK